MSTEDEREDLARNPLPEIVPKEYDVREIPTSVYNVENRMREIADEMKKLSKLRDTLIDRAIATGIINDGKCVIIKRESNLPRVVNPEGFAKKFPTEYGRAKKAERNDLLDKIKEIEAKIPEAGNTIKIKNAQKFLVERDVDSVCYPHKIVTKYEVYTIVAAKAMKLLKE